MNCGVSKKYFLKFFILKISTVQQFSMITKINFTTKRLLLLLALFVKYADYKIILSIYYYSKTINF